MRSRVLLVGRKSPLLVQPNQCSIKMAATRTSARLRKRPRDHTGLVALSAPLMGVFLASLLPAQQLRRIVAFQWLVLRSGMAYLWHCDCSPVLSLTLFTLV